MSKLFFDGLDELKDLEREINLVTSGHDEKLELWQLVDEIIHHRVLDLIFEKLPSRFHQEFLKLYQGCPHDEQHFDYLNEKFGEDSRALIGKEISVIAVEIISEFVPKENEND